jgi:hypothetical protein
MVSVAPGDLRVRATTSSDAVRWSSQLCSIAAKGRRVSVAAKAVQVNRCEDDVKRYADRNGSVRKSQGSPRGKHFCCQNLHREYGLPVHRKQASMQGFRLFFERQISSLLAYPQYAGMSMSGTLFVVFAYSHHTRI